MWLAEVVNANKHLSVLLLLSSVLSTGFQWLKPNCHFSELQIQKVMVPNGNKGNVLFLGSVNVCHVLKTLFCWNQLSASKVIDI